MKLEQVKEGSIKKFDEKKLNKDTVIRKFRTTVKDGKSYHDNCYWFSCET